MQSHTDVGSGSDLTIRELAERIAPGGLHRPNRLRSVHASSNRSGRPDQAREKLGWVPQITLDLLIAEMVSHDLDKARRHALLRNHGFNVAIRTE